MRARRLVGLPVLVVVVLVASACVTVRDGDDDGDRRPGMHSAMRDGPGDRRCDRDRRSLGMMPGGGMMHARTMMKTPLDEEEFLVEMIAHHEEAVAAARHLERSDRSRMRELGEAIVTAQTAEIDDMRGWLDEWYDESPDATYEAMMRDLSGLDGDGLDRAFLRDMIGHHMMAVMMAHRLLACGGDLHDEVVDLAKSISLDQRREIVTMSAWLRQWFGAAGWHGSMQGMGWVRRMHGS